MLFPVIIYAVTALSLSFNEFIAFEFCRSVSAGDGILGLFTESLNLSSLRFMLNAFESV
jgi:hypothetical protein